MEKSISSSFEISKLPDTSQPVVTFQEICQLMIIILMKI